MNWHKIKWITGFTTLAIVLAITTLAIPQDTDQVKKTTRLLPPPNLDGNMSLEKALANRRSQRRFATDPLPLETVSQLCWAAQGITDPKRHLRAAPSAGAIYPLTVYLVDPYGLYEYHPDEHQIIQVMDGDLRTKLKRACYGQSVITSAPLSMIIVAKPEKTAAKYGPRARDFCLLEAGHLAQNVLLQATAIDLAGVPIGGFEPPKAAQLLNLEPKQEVLYIIALGRPISP